MGEKIEILVFLSGDEAPEIRQKAFETLENWPVHELQQLLAEPATSREVIDFAANHLVAGRSELVEAMLSNPALPEDLRIWIEGSPSGPQQPPSPPATQEAGQPGAEGDTEGKKRQTLLQKISQMSTPEKIRLARLGSQEERLLLVRDPNKIVARTVLQSPKLTESEVEAIASMKTVTEEIFRLIAVNRGFMKRYGVVYALVNNPRAPVDVTLPLVNRLNDRDLKGLMINKNVPDVLRTMATRMVKQKQEAQKPKFPGAKH